MPSEKLRPVKTIAATIRCRLAVLAELAGEPCLRAQEASSAVPDDSAEWTASVFVLALACPVPIGRRWQWQQRHKADRVNGDFDGSGQLAPRLHIAKVELEGGHARFDGRRSG